MKVRGTFKWMNLPHGSQAAKQLNISIISPLSGLPVGRQVRSFHVFADASSSGTRHFEHTWWPIHVRGLPVGRQIPFLLPIRKRFVNFMTHPKYSSLSGFGQLTHLLRSSLTWKSFDFHYPVERSLILLGILKVLFVSPLKRLPPLKVIQTFTHTELSRSSTFRWMSDFWFITNCFYEHELRNGTTHTQHLTFSDEFLFL